MLATEQARLESWQLGLSLKGRRRRPNNRIVRGSCPAQVGSKKNAAGNRDTISTAAKPAAAFGSCPTCSVERNGFAVGGGGIA